MFKIKNASGSFKSLNVLHNGKILTIGLGADETSEEIDDFFKGYFQQEAVEWAIVLQRETITEKPVEIKSIGKPKIEHSQAKRKYTKRG